MILLTSCVVHGWFCVGQYGFVWFRMVLYGFVYHENFLCYRISLHAFASFPKVYYSHNWFQGLSVVSNVFVS